MKGPQDLGGMMGFGPINPERDEPLFHAPWEKRVLGITLAVGGTGSWTIDQSRHEREKLAPSFYWSKSYYEIWLQGLIHLLRDRGMVTGKDWAAQRVVDPPKPVKRVLAAANIAGILAKGAPYERPSAAEPRFSPGQAVQTKKITTHGHSRLPGYAMGKRGVIARVHGHHVFPDSSGMGQGEDPHWLYSVRFAAAELWGRKTPDCVHIDLWEPYLTEVVS